jgi:amidase
MTTWILELDGSGTGTRVAVKDIIDMVGLPTTAGSQAVAERAEPALADAECMAGLRAAEAAGEARVVGKANLHELALGVTGINHWSGTPRNPLGADLVPGGSSSGSAVAVGAGEADIAYGSDTGGSVRIPAACCGVTGLKTTWGRISTAGVWPLAPSLDTIGPLARDVAGVIAGMALLEPGFEAGVLPGRVRVGRLRLPATAAVDAALDAALRAADVDVADTALPGWAAADAAGLRLLAMEAWESDEGLFPSDGSDPAIGIDVATRLRMGGEVTPDEAEAAWSAGEAWRAELAAQWEAFDVIALPTLADVPVTVDDPARMAGLRYTVPVNLAGVPALSLPVPLLPGASGRPVPPSLQLVGPAGSEPLLLALGLQIELAVGPASSLQG